MAIIEQINGKNKTYTGLRRVIDYILRDDKEELQELKDYSEKSVGNMVL